MRNYSIAGKRGQWPAPEDTSLSYLILSYLGVERGPHQCSRPWDSNTRYSCNLLILWTRLIIRLAQGPKEYTVWKLAAGSNATYQPPSRNAHYITLRVMVLGLG